MTQFNPYLILQRTFARSLQKVNIFLIFSITLRRRAGEKYTYALIIHTIIIDLLNATMQLSKCEAISEQGNTGVDEGVSQSIQEVRKYANV